MTALRFRVWKPTKRITHSNHHNWNGGRFKQGGYWKVKVEDHPQQDSRGYVLEHRLVMEQRLQRYLDPEEYVHHIDGDRGNNEDANLELMPSQKEHMGHHRGKKNPNGRFVADSPEFRNKKFRLFNKDTGETRVYDLSKLIGTTFRRGKFEYRGESTGLHDKNGVEIFEGDIAEIFLSETSSQFKAVYDVGEASFRWYNEDGDHSLSLDPEIWKPTIIGNIYENPELLNG